MDIKVLNTGLLRVNSLIVPLCKNKVFVVDPAACSYSHDGDKITAYLRENGLECYAIVLTHSHFDHITGIDVLKKAFPAAKIAIHENEANELENPPGPMGQSVLRFFGLEELYNVVAGQPPADVLLAHGCTLKALEGEGDSVENATSTSAAAEKVSAVNIAATNPTVTNPAATNAPAENPANSELLDVLSQWKVLLTPGHTPGSICLYNKKENILISGDTLFQDSWGRTDMYGGNEQEIFRSLRYLREKIPVGTKVYPGHDSSFVMGS